MTVLDATPVAEATTAEGLFAAWAGAFGVAVDSGDPAAIAATIVADGYWRDILAFTWDFRTHSGRDEIIAGLRETLPTVRPGNVRVAADRMAPRAAKRSGRPVVEGYVDIDTAVGRATAFVRLLPDAGPAGGPIAWVLLTALQELRGFEEQLGERRPSGTEYSWEFGGDNWAEKRAKSTDFADRDPEVVIIGAGQAGLTLGARLTQFGVDALIVERHDRVGDNWRSRYHSLTLHNEVWANSLPYIPFPPTWPTFLPKDKLAGWLEFYAEAMELNVWTGADFQGGTFDEATQCWTLTVVRADGTERVLTVPHLVLATGGVSGTPRLPALPGLASFEGQVVHSSQFASGTSYEGRRAIVVGTGNSGHDVAQDLYTNGAAEVTMIQRGPTCVVSLVPSGTMVYELYSTGPVEDIDLITAATPYPILEQTYQWLTRKTCDLDHELIDGLEKAGFRTGYGEDGTGFHMKYLRTGGGYYINVGCSDLIIDGKVRLVQDADTAGFFERGLRLADGTVIEADIVALATGYENMQDGIRRFIGQDVAEKVGPVWGFNDQGFMRAMWKRTGQQGFWLMGGALNECRLYSRFLALQIKADLEGLLPARRV